ncbi:MAG TPA: SLC13 family permease [Caulobacteraceae bacterium]|jgi:di/tricarboxylate transporter
MNTEQLVTLAVLAAVVAALIWDKVRSDVVALTGAAVLLLSGAVRPVEVQVAFASPAIIALASLFVIAYAMELSGLLDLMIRSAVKLCRFTGAMGLWGVIVLCGAASAFLNNSPIVVLASPVVRDVANSLGLSPKRFLMPLSYVTVLGGCCTLIGTSTNLLVNDMARAGGERPFGIFEVTPVGVSIAVAGALYLLLFGGRLLRQAEPAPADTPTAPPPGAVEGESVGEPAVFAAERPLRPLRAIASLVVFVGVIVIAAYGLAPIAASAFAGAVLLVLLRVIGPDEAYGGLRPQILLLIAGMVVLGLALEQTGLAAAATNALVDSVEPLGPLLALVLLYGATLFLTELLSNATVAVLLTPVAVALAESLGVEARPFVVAVMMAGSAAFATPFGYQTNVLVYQMGRYNYMDFVRVGLPLNVVTWVVGSLAIPVFFPFQAATPGG